ncbi:ABC-type glycerol-3-phosphate transport system substrate-binding protein [Paenibacillus rhizosphaerae]|uniref:ABC-type glycerol-3-phosphate transport system substrate-binding protein n=1 Tax=Paenibacillus rhizosphaerae TaxID=297318 RepID=A0A839TNM8_9BACL|nr:extracellular solute-binding protein [Paenibacillus rhizosphaerae]MBB3127028.1 ABC-type glycerol-3-phosphate transport system substrate-binding protein [Paenibacillus rhizosphaerae]
MKTTEDFVDGVFDLYKVDGKYNSVTQVTSFGLTMVYNKDLFKNAGLPDLPTDWNDPSWTWDKMVEYAKKLTSNYGKGINAQYGIASVTDNPHTLSFLFGGNPYLPETYTTSFAESSNLDDPKVISACRPPLI